MSAFLRYNYLKNLMQKLFDKNSETTFKDIREHYRNKFIKKYFKTFADEMLIKTTNQRLNNQMVSEKNTHTIYTQY